MVRFLFYFGDHFFDLVYLLFRSLIPSDNGFRNCTRLRVRFNVSVFDLGFLS
jgi:hypothetical protein